MDENVQNSCILHEIFCSIKRNFKIGKIYADAKIHHQGKFEPQEINPLYGS